MKVTAIHLFPLNGQSDYSFDPPEQGRLVYEILHDQKGIAITKQAPSQKNPGKLTTIETTVTYNVDIQIDFEE